MPFRFESWEFLFVLNMILALGFPFLSRIPAPPRMVAGAVFLLPFILGIGEWIFIKSDLSFYLLLAFLHYGVSFLNLFVVFRVLEQSFQRPLRAYYLLLLGSLILSIGLIPFSTSLRFVDPFWGIIPGTVSMDAIIDLYPYWLRLAFSVLALIPIFIITGKKSALLFVPLYLVLEMTLGFFYASPITPAFSLRRAIGNSSAASSQFEVFVEDGSYPLSAESWNREFQFHLDRLLERLPEKEFKIGEKPFHIFIFRDDDSKVRWIGARRPQIGNFLRSEIYLSDLDPTSSIIPHELVHLLHGRLSAPLRSYIDSFLLEGFAVALSAEDLDRVQREAAAIAQALPSFPTRWPQGFDFFSRLPPAASYRLAGGFAAHSLQQKNYPWNPSINFPIEDLKKLKPSELELQTAKKLLERPVLLKDPNQRDCSRLEWEFGKFPSERGWKKLANLCPRSPYLRPFALAIRALPLSELESEQSRGDSAVLDGDQKKALEFYLQCSQSLCPHKSKLIRDYGLESLQEILRSELQDFRANDPTEFAKKEAAAILKKLGDDAEALKVLIGIEPLHLRPALFDRLRKIRRLSPEENLEAAEAEFYAAIVVNRGAALATSRSVARKLLLGYDFPETAEAEVFVDRLAWEIEH